jgi:GT2 family glycosyltransferase
MNDPQVLADLATTTARMRADLDLATHVFVLDDDILPPPDGLLRLLAHDVPIVSGLCVQRDPPHLPAAYRRGADLHVPLTRFCAGLQSVDAVGAACLLVKTEVFQRLEPPWFEFAPGFSEDLFFCAQARRHGYEVLLDFAVQCGHLTTLPVTYQDFARHAGAVTFGSEELRMLSQDVRPWRR